MTILKRVDINVEGNKRQHAPYELINNCPNCGIENVVRLYDKDYLDFPTFGEMYKFGFYCKNCEEEWNIPIKVNIVIELI